MANVLNFMPELEPDEMAYVQSVMQQMNEAQAQQFTNIYRSRRRDPMLVLITAAAGFFGAAGIHRFITGDIVMGILYFFTVGFCFIGTIVDVINYKRLAFTYNIKEAHRAGVLVTGQFGGGAHPY
ncbi:MAG: rane protein [Adhaeribacter sp.]|jgi:TM2 domain-containing membrane protein YozV|nr:rane protein [Adhaeribacter sp.]